MNNKIRNEMCKTTKLWARVAMTFLGVAFFMILCMLLSFVLTLKLGIDVEEMRRAGLGMSTFLIASLVLITGATFVMMRKVFSPLEHLSEASKRVAEGDYSVEVIKPGAMKELGNTIQNFNRMVKELNSVEIMRNGFIADVSHEFKTPLAAISGYATFLQDPTLSQEEKNEYIHKIFFNIEKLNDLTENILQLSKLEHQQFMYEPIVFRLDEQIREAIVMLEPRWSSKQMNLELELPEKMYRGHGTLLFQVWVNLIGNAIKYTDVGGNISIQLRETRDWVQVVVSDDGIGMSEEVQVHIFDKFYQGDTSRCSQGNGLGLALCKEIMDKCGGEIHVESSPGIGSVFIVNLNKDFL